ncbi:MAG: hypothetical protein U5Q44_08315 [Dehalococcoidia bacterium]|nr:hypothetical protein [Dehalococcoidia bacterium]
MPRPPGHEPANDPHVLAIAEAARELNELREAWLNPPEMAADFEPDLLPDLPPRPVPVDEEAEKELKKLRP